MEEGTTSDLHPAASLRNGDSEARQKPHLFIHSLIHSFILQLFPLLEWAFLSSFHHLLSANVCKKGLCLVTQREERLMRISAAGVDLHRARG